MNWLNSWLNGFDITFHIRTLMTIFHLGKRYQIIGGETCLTSGGYEDNDRLSIREFFYVIESWFVHGSHTWAVVLFTESFEVNLNGNRSNCWSKVEESVLISTKPFCHIRTVRHCCWQTDHSNLRFFVHSTHDNFKNCSSLLSQEMNFIENDQPNFFSVFSVLRSCNTIPFLRRCNNDVCFIESFEIGSKVPTQFNNRFLDLFHSWNPVFESFLDQWFQWSDVNTFFLRLCFKKMQNCQFTHDCFTTACWSSD